LPLCVPIKYLSIYSFAVQLDTDDALKAMWRKHRRNRNYSVFGSFGRQARAFRVGVYRYFRCRPGSGRPVDNFSSRT
jgi:hypothetical protein